MPTYIKPTREDTVSRPDHYVCTDCQNKFNDAIILKDVNEEIFYAQAVCPSCRSSRLIISWWVS